MRPTECMLCGCKETITDSDAFIHFRCGSAYWPGPDVWSLYSRCGEKLLDRIQRALDKIKNSKRWSAEKTAKTPIAYYPDPDGWIAQGSDMDEVARILEGDADERAE